MWFGSWRPATQLKRRDINNNTCKEPYHTDQQPLVCNCATACGTAAHARMHALYAASHAHYAYAAYLRLPFCVPSPGPGHSGLSVELVDGGTYKSHCQKNLTSPHVYGQLITLVHHAAHCELHPQHEKTEPAANG